MKAANGNAFARWYRGRCYITVYTSQLDRHRQHKHKNLTGPNSSEAAAWKAAAVRLKLAKEAQS